MYESYGYPDIHGVHPQPETPAFWDQPENVQHPSTGQPPGGPGEAHPSWDPVEELAILLQESAAPGQPEPFTRGGFDAEVTGDTVSTLGLVAGLKHTPTGRPPTQASSGHRRNPSRPPAVTLLQTGSVFAAVLVGAIAAVVSGLSGLAICDALRHSAEPHMDRDVASWWPMLIYGPWMVASLSILRSALHQRRALHSWSIVLLFSTLATLLCVAQAPRTIASVAGAALPAVAALACFQQLVRQITLTRPPRQAAPRHRNPTPSVSVPLGKTAAARRSPGSFPSGYRAGDNTAVRSPSHGHRFG
ncbi:MULTISPECIES: DUF2637 domain-containing protein [unclassified Streptomyces]|uniref:DUF2637 domain-containing protein n=1 Tax=unclassified Streptomyces TaxID=2593676 RepID=UPI0029AC33E4|nr:DUF2637 domain-containing protein [Streptomyces sp. DK15]MDX2389574.1 DUF2637 domain-containing protein [Streptomyces sp. DK15]